MAEFVCKVADARGRISTQVEIGGSATEVRKRLDGKGLYVYSVRGRTLPQWLGRSSGRGHDRLPANDFLLFNQQLATLIRAGLPILQSLDLLAKRANKPALTKVLDTVRERVKGGAAISQAMQETGVFPPVYTTAVLAGERSGDLVGVLDQYITYQKTTGMVRRRLLTALIYPSFLIGFSLLVLTVVILYVIPRFADLYADMNAQLPALTLAVIAFAAHIRGSLIVLGLAAAGAVAGGIVLTRSAAGARWLDGVWMELPLVGDVIRKFRLAQFSRTLGTLLRGGVPLVKALETAGGAMDSPVLRHAFDRATERVREGQSLNVALAATGVMPVLVTEMVEVGEATGSLPAMLTSVAEFYDEELDSQINGLLAAVGPLLLLLVGAVVLVILLALYLPIFSVGGAIQ